MYTVVLMAALAPGHATTGQYGAAAPTCACRGCWGCYGGYTGSGYNYMAARGYLSAFSTYAPVSNAAVYGCNGCYGCYGGWSCYRAPLPGHGNWSAAPPAAAPGKAAPNAEETPAPKEQLAPPKEKTNAESTRAQLTLDVPEGAKVYLDGELMNLSAGNRLFQTPPLVAGRVYFYDLRVEVTQGGKTVTESQRVILRPGQTAVAAFPGLNRDSTVPVANR